ncbi:hypothetical protein VTL71DRAFT_12231 [Oculimacula yallundae]|uniref:C2H2-type domain-containing protein n=1 Tax=Oculimacula yallundae TaxID=86028 RepID=A0ABR4CSC0_9HELO
MASMTLISTHYRQCHNAFVQLLSATSFPHPYEEQISTGQVQNEFDRFRLWAGNVGAPHLGSRYSISLDYRLRAAPFHRSQIIRILGKLQEFVRLPLSFLCGGFGLQTFSYSTVSYMNLLFTKISMANCRLGCSLVTDEIQPFELTESSTGSGSSSNTSSDGELALLEPSVLTQEQVDEKNIISRLRASATEVSRMLTPETSFPKEPEHTTQTQVQPECLPIESQHIVVGARANQEHPVERHDDVKEIPQLLRSIRLTISTLYRMPIRRPAASNESRLSSVDVSHYREFDARHIRDRFPLAPADLTEQLLASTLRRRQILLYRALHYENIKSIIPEQEYDSVTSESRSTEPTLKTKGTTFRPEDFSQMSHDVSDAETIQSAASSDASAGTKSQLLIVPVRPQGLAESGEFLCPYCFVVCYIKTDSAWRHHVFKDLEPYFCTYASCSEKDRQFGNRDDWYEHEKQNHCIRWDCNTEGHQPFESEVQFLLHIKSEHGAMLPLVQSSETLNMFKRPARDALTARRECPFCRKIATKPKIHISRHMEQVALYVLGGQNIEDDEDCEDNVAGYSNTHRSSISGESLSSSTSDIIAEIDQIDEPGEAPNSLEDAAQRSESSNDANFQLPGAGKSSPFGRNGLICPHDPCPRGGQPFWRQADVQRHVRNVHEPPYARDMFACSYNPCLAGRHLDGHFFSRKDHYRDHLQDYHLEDIYAAKGEKSARTEIERNKWKERQKEWLATRKISALHWRCPKCLSVNWVSKGGWLCTVCTTWCTKERIEARQRLSPADLVDEPAVGDVLASTSGDTQDDRSRSALGISKNDKESTHWEMREESLMSMAANLGKDVEK